MRKAVTSMKRFGIHGPNSIPASFYQKYWEIGDGVITNLVNSALLTGKVPEVLLMSSFISLIPKKERPKNAHDFRTITILNVSLKIISKVLVNWMWSIMQRVIGPHQNNFLSGRSTLDNIILT